MAMAQAQLQAAAGAVAGLQQPARSTHAAWAAPLRPSAAPHAALAVRLEAVAAVRAGSRRRAALVPQAVAAAEKVAELTLQPVRVIEGHVKLPGSKSLSNRILLLAALAEGVTTVENILVGAGGGWRRRRQRVHAVGTSTCQLAALCLPHSCTIQRNLLPAHCPTPQDSEDIRYMVGALKTLGVQLEEDWANDRLVVTGCAGRFPGAHGKCCC